MEILELAVEADQEQPWMTDFSQAVLSLGL